jgi:hypothetical protein
VEQHHPKVTMVVGTSVVGSSGGCARARVNTARTTSRYARASSSAREPGRPSGADQVTQVIFDVGPFEAELASDSGNRPRLSECDFQQILMKRHRANKHRVASFTRCVRFRFEDHIRMKSERHCSERCSTDPIAIVGA